MSQDLRKINQFIEEKAKEINPQYRNHYHFMAPVGWINDPNGFIYFQGAYHLFYQYYPHDSVWGPMHWGHAKSQDLLHWEHLPVALAPGDSYDKDGCFSGSAIEKDGKLYLIYTGHMVEGDQVRQVQCLAVSEDGVQFKKYENNPIIHEQHITGVAQTNDFRDPKIFQRGEDYYTVVAAKTADERGQILLFKSADLYHWQFKSVLLSGTKEQGIMWECPDLFELDGKDVLLMSPIQMSRQDFSYHNINSTVAFIGQVNWETGTFIPENYHEIDYGLDFYAPQTCLDADGRRVMIAWMQMWQRNIPTHELGHGWAGSMTLPRELRIVNNRLLQKPISFVHECMTITKTVPPSEIDQQGYQLKGLVTDQHYLRLEFDVQQADTIQIAYAKSAQQTFLLTYSVSDQCFTISREKIGLPITGQEANTLNLRQVKAPLLAGKLVIEIFRDTSSIEVFLQEGITFSTTFYEIEKGYDLEITTDATIVLLQLESGEIR